MTEKIGPYYLPNKLGRDYLAGQVEGPEKAVVVLEAFTAFDDTMPKVPQQVARVLGIPAETVRPQLDYLTKQGFLKRSAKPPTPRDSPREPARPGGVRRKDQRTEEDFVRADVKAKLSRERYDRSSKGKTSRDKYWKTKGKAVRRTYWRSSKGKAAQARWRSKLRLSEEGQEKLFSGLEGHEEWTLLHDLLSFVHLDHPTKEELSEEDFKTLYDNKYI